MNDFDWSQEKESVVFHGYGSVAVYLNPRGDVVIRQEADALSEEDSVVIIPRANIDVLLRAVRDAVETETVS